MPFQKEVKIHMNYESIEDDVKVEEVNPLTAIWYAPRKAMRSVIEYKPTSFVLTLAILYGITEMFDEAIGEEYGETLSLLPILLIILIGGALSGIIGLAITAGLSAVIGRWFGGTGYFKEMFKAISAAYIPVAFSIIIYLFHLIFVGAAIFVEVEISFAQSIWLLFGGLITIVLSFWTLVLTFIAIAEVHKFSIWRAIATYIIPGILLIGLLLAFIFFIALFV